MTFEEFIHKIEIEDWRDNQTPEFIGRVKAALQYYYDDPDMHEYLERSVETYGKIYIRLLDSGLSSGGKYDHIFLDEKSIAEQQHTAVDGSLQDTSLEEILGHEFTHIGDTRLQGVYVAELVAGYDQLSKVYPDVYPPINTTSITPDSFDPANISEELRQKIDGALKVRGYLGQRGEHGNHFVTLNQGMSKWFAENSSLNLYPRDERELAAIQVINRLREKAGMPLRSENRDNSNANAQKPTPEIEQAFIPQGSAKPDFPVTVTTGPKF